MRIKKLRRIKADCAVYDIEVDVDHSFIVGGCVLHNCVVCGSYDGKLFKSIKDAPQLPLHRGCRCLLSPWFDIEGGTRESADGYVSDKVTFEDWLKAQDEKTQKEVLGKTRFELFKSGEPITQFVEGGEALSIKELNERLEAEKGAASATSTTGGSAFKKIAESHTRKQDLRATNPHYSEGAEWRQNCQRAVSAYEARRRGFDVTAMPARDEDINTGFRHLSYTGGFLSAYENPAITECASNSGKEAGNKVMEKMKEWGNGARAIVVVEWDKKKVLAGGGHAFFTERIGDRTFFFDPQKNRTDASGYFEKAKERVYVIRVDNLKFSDKISMCCEDVK